MLSRSASLNAKFTNSIKRDSGIVALAQQYGCTTLKHWLPPVHQDLAPIPRLKYNRMNNHQNNVAHRLLHLVDL